MKRSNAPRCLNGAQKKSGPATENTNMRILILVGVFATGSLVALGGEISDYYFQHSQENTNRIDQYTTSLNKSRSNQQVESTNHSITEIGIERSGCYGTCPIYTFVARSDGTFRYKGDKYVERTGEFSGTIPVWQFHALARFIADSGYMAFEDEYTRMVTDCATTFTSVVQKGKRKVISNYAEAGPTTLWAIEQLVDDLMAKAQWKEELPRAPEPVLPKVTRYDGDPILRKAYLDFFRKGYVDAWERKESLPIFGPTSDADKARVLGYGDGSVAGRSDRDKWFGTNAQQIGATNTVTLKR